MSDVIQFPQEKPPEFMVGPFREWRVVIEGRLIPHLTAFHDGDEIGFVIDNRFSVSVSKEKAHSIAWLIANAMAVSAGYPSFSAETKEQPFAHKAWGIGTPDDEPGGGGGVTGKGEGE